jgi:hypothetical protein
MQLCHLGRRCRECVTAWVIAQGGMALIAAAQDAEPAFPPALPHGRAVVTDQSAAFLAPPATLREDVEIATSPPSVDFLFYPGQDYPGHPWSNWGEGTAADGKYYSAIGDHLAIVGKREGGHGNGSAFVFEYETGSHQVRELVNTARLLNLPDDHYWPGKIHTRVELGRDGWVYFATHRGSTRATSEQYHYEGDWIVRTHPETGEAEVVAHGPVPGHAIPAGLLDPDRLIFYGATAPGTEHEAEGIRFFAYDVSARQLLYAGPDGPARGMMLARSTGRLYYVPGKNDGPLMRFDPSTAAPPVQVEGTHIGLRCATDETPDGFIYTVSLGQQADDAMVWSFNTRTEETKPVGTAAVGTQAYVASIDADPSGRFLYYVPGAHGGSDRDGAPVVQFDVQTGRKKVIAFLEPFYAETYGFTLKGTYSTVVDPEGDKLYITWNVSRGTRAWDCCGLTVVHIPDSER